jgi:hypothetical protein
MDPAMAIQDDDYVPESNGPSSSAGGGAPPEPGVDLPALVDGPICGSATSTLGLADTIELGRRAHELAEKLRSGATERRRPPSFRILAKQLGATQGVSSIWRAAAIYRLAQRYPELYTYRHVGVGHLAVLLSLRGPLQLALLRRAERMGWSRRKLEAKVKRIREGASTGIDSALLAELGVTADDEREL